VRAMSKRRAAAAAANKELHQDNWDRNAAGEPRPPTIVERLVSRAGQWILFTAVR